ncbi:MAG: RNA 3'-phosphate cyclase [Chloroflexi bacterium]|nr:RNA 3'-phosphate cyclase [Chloroflexota bacterium]
MIKIDGSYGEGGGQVLRTSLALAAITGRTVRIEHIRAGRKKPGLRPQHLTAVRVAAAVCAARLEGDALGSQTVTLAPGSPVCPGSYVFDVADATRGGSAGSVGLVLQTVLLPLALAQPGQSPGCEQSTESYLILRGGTHVAWAPSVAYLEHVFVPALARMGIRAEDAQIDLARWGFYPVGGGEIQVRIMATGGSTQAEPLSPIQLTERGDLTRIWGTAAVMNLPAHIPQRMANRACNVLAEAGLKAQVEALRLRGNGPGAGIFLFAEYETSSPGETVVAGFTAYGRKGLPAERVAEAACEELFIHHRSGAPVDPYLADQLVLPMALADGESRMNVSQVTPHLLTNIWVVRQFLAVDRDHPVDVHVEGELGSPGTVVIKGQGHD